MTCAKTDPDMAHELTKAELEARAEHAGLRLSPAELERLLPGVNRSRRQAEELRSWIFESVEPATVFAATGPKASRHYSRAE